MFKKIFFSQLVLFFFFNSISAQISMDDGSSNSNSRLALQQISVTIGGEFIVNGTYPASATERVDQFVTRIYNQFRLALLSTTKDERSLRELKEEIDEFAVRGIVLKHSNKSEEIIDLQNFRLTANYDKNPYLINGDVLIFPPLDWERNFIEIEGAVNNPTQFQFVEGDRLSSAILFARGINPAYENVKNIEITRLSYDGMNKEIIPITIEDNPLLKRGDRIRIVAVETQKRDFKVLVDGEVNRPGYIYITKDRTTIKEVIEKAGGYKKNADLINAELIRQSSLKNNNIPYQNRRRSFNIRSINRQTDLLMMNRMADIETEDSLSLIYDNQLRNLRSIVTVDFNEVLNDSSDNSNFIVKDGDIIYVPEITNLIYVFGQVMNPGFIDYIDGLNYQYYIEKTGGIGNRAKDEVYLIKGKTRAWIDMTDENNQFRIESGDYIWIPKDIPRNYDYYLNRTAKIAGIIGSVATVVLLLTQIGK
jgi:protein involved in polysaccharide export with SLBB domain